METVKMQYLGAEPTLVRAVVGGAKIEVKKGDTVEVEKGLSKHYLTLYKGKWCAVGGTVKAEVVDPADVEGEVEVTKAKAGRPKKKVE